MIGQRTLQLIDDLLQENLKAELSAQGHYLTGALEESIRSDVAAGGGLTLEIEANHYIKWVNEGFPAASASWKQLPFLIEYFQKRGLSAVEAKGAAAATITKWMKEGMPTQSSSAYSSNQRRTGALEQVLAETDSEMDRLIEEGFSDELDEAFEMGKDITI